MSLLVIEVLAVALVTIGAFTAVSYGLTRSDLDYQHPYLQTTIEDQI